MMVTYAPKGINNFHERPPLKIRLEHPDARYEPVVNDEVYLLSRRQADRIKKHFCGDRHCRCPQGAVVQLDGAGTRYALLVRYVREEPL